MNHLARTFASLLLLSFAAACSQQDADQAASPEPAAAPPAESAEAFVARINEELAELGRELGAAGWVRATYITEDTALLQSRARERYAAWHSDAVRQALQYDGQELAPETRRALDLLKLGTSLPSPSEPAKRRELTQIATEMKGMYGAGKYCRNGNDCLSGPELEALMQTSRDYDELLDAWQGWRDDRAAHARHVRALCRTRERGRQGTRLRRPRRDVARELRHEPGRVRGRNDTSLGAGEAAV